LLSPSKSDTNCVTAVGVTCGITFFSGIVAAGSAASGAAGAGILKAAGYAAYGVTQAARAGAAGGAVASVPIAIVLGCCGLLFGSEKDESKKNQIGQFILGASIAALSGALGYAMVYSGQADVEMSAGQFAAATAVGSTVISGGAAVLNAICGR
jgi:hypothetical protein